MKPLGWRWRRTLASSAQAPLRAEAERLIKQADAAGVRLRASAREAERTISFADSAWRQVEKIAEVRGISKRHAIAEALSVWEMISPLLGESEGPLEVRVKGKTRVVLVRREHTAHPLPDVLATYPR